jgi:hypothetical protein
MWHRWGRIKMHIGIWWSILKERDHLIYLAIDGKKILKWMLKKSIARAWTEFIWLGMGRGGLWGTVITSGFHKMLGIS